LRDRREDVPMLLAHFLERYCLENTKPLRQFTPGALKLLMDYDWPGNVRELENVVERAVVLSTQERVDVDLLPESIRSKEIVRGVRLQLSEFLPPLPGEAGSRSAAITRSRPCFKSWTRSSVASLLTCLNAPAGTRPKPPNAS